MSTDSSSASACAHRSIAFVESSLVLYKTSSRSKGFKLSPSQEAYMQRLQQQQEPKSECCKRTRVNFLFENVLQVRERRMDLS
eukprot:764205-Hanusia_phi.AAC.2